MASKKQSKHSGSNANEPPALTTAPASDEALLDGLERLLDFLFEEEADHLCGAPLHMRSHRRVNYRIGYYARKFHTRLGTLSLRIPHLLHFHPRVPIVKRAARLNGSILDALVNIRASGADSENAGALIKMLWTVELSDELFAVLTGKLVVALNKWRDEWRDEWRDAEPVAGAASD